jgi:hypothetical protein
MYFTQDIVDANGIAKKQFYTSIGMQDFTTWEIVQVRQFVGEHSKQELIDLQASVIARGTPTAKELTDRLEQANLQSAEINNKLACFI